MQHYIVIDRQTGKQATRTTYRTLRAAIHAVNRLDAAYGAARYFHKSTRNGEAQ